MGFFGGVEWRTPIDKPDAQGGVLLRRLDRRTGRARRRLRAQVPVQLRRASTACATGITLGGYYMYGSKSASTSCLGQPVPAADAAEPRHRPAAGQRPAGGRDRGTGWVEQRAEARQADRRARRRAGRRGHRARGMRFARTDGRRLYRQPPDHQTPRPSAAPRGSWRGPCPTRSRQFRITRSRAACPSPRSRSTASRHRGAGGPRRTPGSASWADRRDSRARAGLTGPRSWRRDVYPLTTGRSSRCRRCSSSAATTAFKPQLTAQFRGS